MKRDRADGLDKSQGRDKDKDKDMGRVGSGSWIGITVLIF